MTNCEHKTEEEFRLCDTCTLLRQIARFTRDLLDARRQMMTGLLKGWGMDELERAVQDKIRLLEPLIERAKRNGLLD